jgi:hypothetical protein
MRIKISKLRSVIRERVEKILAENENDLNKEKIGSIGAGYRWKETIMQTIQDSLAMQSTSIHSQEDFQKAIDMEIEKIRADIDTTLTMIGRTLYQIPYNVFLAAKNKK